MKQVLDYLETKNIKYEIIHHQPAMTTEEADKYIEGKEGVRSKTMFMTNKKDKKPFVIKAIFYLYSFPYLAKCAFPACHRYISSCFKSHCSP